ncbi:uncharacterized protein DMAD_04906 [Drosophila madeirensis]|uniref:LITAF domain-containing protein n=1 Tax=Drosophila madeirensis TaxID=30013 RepID=A0AAU9GFQ3_DROMD|nr:uncharacterized protein LOC117889925 [Drosophila subobscura]
MPFKLLPQYGPASLVALFVDWRENLKKEIRANVLAARMGKYRIHHKYHRIPIECCPRCKSTAVRLEIRTSRSQWKKLKKNLVELCFCRPYIPAGMYKQGHICRSCGWMDVIKIC